MREDLLCLLRINSNFGPICRSESAGFLRRHCELHGVKDYRWPPDYVGVPQEQLESLMAASRRKSFSGPQIAFTDAFYGIRRRRKRPLPFTRTLRCVEDGCEFIAASRHAMVAHELRAHRHRFEVRLLAGYGSTYGIPVFGGV